MNHSIMKTVLGVLFLFLTACGKADNQDGPGQGGAENKEDKFVKGADISWVTEMEQDGLTFKNAQGVTTDCFQLMKEIGMDAIRLRVWVNPQVVFCNKADVLAKARRAHAQGLKLMIDFHYSDWFADPGRQNMPADWDGKTLQELRQAVADHTVDVLQALKSEGIEPAWVQVGNETRNGMMWPAGQLWNEQGDLTDGWKNYVSLSNAGYEAVKSIFPEANVLVHIDNAWDDQTWWFDKFTQFGGKFDMIGLSHYPQTHQKLGWEEMNRRALEHIQLWAERFDCRVMICEVGVKSADEALAARVLTGFMTEAMKLEQCAGVFYWEPQVYGGWKPAIYNSLGWGAYDMGAFTSDGRPAAALDVFSE